MARAVRVAFAGMKVPSSKFQVSRKLQASNFNRASAAQSWNLELGTSMPLPDLIEIVPLSKPVRAEITVPGSKSITNRALILAALAEGETTLQGALWSEDTQVMVDCLQDLGFMVNVAPDPKEICNRTISLYGLS